MSLLDVLSQQYSVAALCGMKFSQTQRSEAIRQDQISSRVSLKIMHVESISASLSYPIIVRSLSEQLNPGSRSEILSSSIAPDRQSLPASHVPTLGHDHPIVVDEALESVSSFSSRRHQLRIENPLQHCLVL